MISFTAIKKMPEFEFLNKTNQAGLLRSYLETYIDSYKKLDAESKKAVEKEIFAFYGINQKSTKKVVSSAFKDIKFEIDGVKGEVKTVKDETTTAIKGLSKEIAKNKPKDLSSDFNGLKDILTSKEGEVKTLLTAIAKNKPKDISPKIDELIKILATNKDEVSGAFDLLLKEIGKPKSVDLTPQINELKVLMSSNKVDIAIQNLTEEISKKTPKEWEFKVERDHRDLIQGITAVQVV